MIEALSSNRKVITIVTVLLLTLVMTISGCSSTKEREVRDVVDIMKKVPKDCWSFIYMDLDAFRNDADLEDEYIRFTESGLSTWADLIGGFHKVDSFTITGRDFGDINVLFGGDFNLVEVRQKLEGSGKDNSEYKGIEVWGKDVALESNKLVILGYVKDCIDAIIDSDNSLYGDKDFRDVVERLPGGIVFGFQEGELSIIQFRLPYDGVVVSGCSILKKDKNSMRITSVSKFENVDSINKVIDSIKQDLANCSYEEFRNISVEQDSEFIKIITDIDMKGFLFGE